MTDALAPRIALQWFSLSLVRQDSGRSWSQSLNFFDLKLRESVARRFFSFDRNDLGGQVSKLGVHGLAGLTSQQVNFPISGF
jgi:hypothetical protein